jgi:uncharacterized membrane protein YhiD involved in acid resistance
VLDNATPQLRAAVKVLMAVVTGLIIGALAVLGIELFGLATVGTAMSVLVLGYFVYLAYTIALSQEQYRDSLKNLQDTIRE